MGSEMCIRDSSQVDQENAGDWFRQGRVSTGEKIGMAYAEGFKRIPFG